VPSSSVAFHLTERCGLRCVHCLRDPSADEADLPVEVVERVLEEASRSAGISSRRRPRSRARSSARRGGDYPRRRYPRGVSPVQALNARANAFSSANPTARATCFTG